MYAGYHAHRREGCQQGRAAIAEKRERNADDRREADAHADIDEGLECHERRNAEADERAHCVAGLHADDDTTDNDGGKQQDDDDTGDHAELLADDAVDKVRVFAGETSEYDVHLPLRFSCRTGAERTP